MLCLIVYFQNGEVYAAKVEDVDLVSDLATIRIPIKGLPVMTLGESADIKPGEWVGLYLLLQKFLVK